MDIAGLLNESPFQRLLDMEVTEIDDGYAAGYLPYDEQLRSSTIGEVAHGGATYALADTVGGAAVMSVAENVTPTVDMRIDYLAPATTDIYAEGEVIRHGSSLAVAHVNIFDESGKRIATAQGTYKTGGQGEKTPWSDLE